MWIIVKVEINWRVMMDRKKLEQIIKKNQRQFLIENNGQISHVARNLISYLTSEGEEEYEALYQFFHRIKGTSGTLELTDISVIADEIETLILTEKGFIKDNDKELSLIVKKTGRLLELIEKSLSDILVEESDILSYDSEHVGIDMKAGKILVVDDDVYMLKFLEAILKNQGFDVCVSSSPDEALVLLKQGIMDLAVIDIVMPGKTGFDIYKEVNTINSKIPIIFMTGLNNKDVRIEALRKGAQIYLKKPINPDELIAHVNGAITNFNKNEEYYNRDELTKAYTRKQFNKKFENEKREFENNGSVFSIAFLDLDDFKLINDTYGHLFGDHILHEIVKIIGKFLKKDGDVFRFGGDEFLILFSNKTRQQAEEVMDDIKRDMLSTVYHSPDNRNDLTVSFSSGIAEFNNLLQNRKNLLEEADRELYKAKNNNRIVKVTDSVNNLIEDESFEDDAVM